MTSILWIKWLFISIEWNVKEEWNVIIESKPIHKLSFFFCFSFWQKAASLVSILYFSHLEKKWKFYSVKKFSNRKKLVFSDVSYFNMGFIRVISLVANYCLPFCGDYGIEQMKVGLDRIYKTNVEITDIIQ